MAYVAALLKLDLFYVQCLCERSLVFCGTFLVALVFLLSEKESLFFLNMLTQCCCS